MTGSDSTGESSGGRPANRAVFVVFVSAGLFLVGIALGMFHTEEEVGDDTAVQSAVLEHQPDPSTLHDLSAAAAVVKSYYAAETVAERARHVRQPDAVRERMFSWYLRNPFERVEEFQVVRSKVTEVNGKPYLGLVVRTPGEKAQLLFLERSPDGYKVEWEASEGYQEVPWKEFLATKPSDPVRMRLQCMPHEGALPQELEGRSDLMPLLVRDPRDPVAAVAFCRTDSEDAQRLREVLSISSSAAIIADLRFPPQDNLGSIIELTNFVQNGWILDDANQR
ncbi:MAG: hypothetical protein AAGA58_08000 [Verrucomicrobiota bacterium]